MLTAQFIGFAVPWPCRHSSDGCLIQKQRQIPTPTQRTGQGRTLGCLRPDYRETIGMFRLHPAEISDAVRSQYYGGLILIGIAAKILVSHLAG